MSRIKAYSIREIRINIERMCNQFIFRRGGWLRSHLTIKTTLKILFHFSYLSENLGISEVVVRGVVRKKHSRWNYFEDEKGRAIC